MNFSKNSVTLIMEHAEENKNGLVSTPAFVKKALPKPEEKKEE